LLDKGADLHARDRTGTDALTRAVRSADLDVIRFLVDRGCDPNQSVIDVAFARPDMPLLEYLMSKGVQPTERGLGLMPYWQPAQLIKRWIDMGANVNARVTGYNRTPLMTAVASEQASAAIVKVLLDNGADENAEDAEGERPLDWAMYRADQSKIE